MFENLYTTKMSSSKKALQRRFTKIRSKSGRLAKFMSLLMALVLMAALGAASVVMAATGSDGLEHWDKNEAYYLSGVKFSINTNGTVVPDWVKEIAGQNGNINVSLEKYAFRDIKGEITTEIIGRFVGEASNLTLSNYTSVFDYGKSERMYFSGSTEGLTNNFNVIPDDGRHIRITFGIDENGLMVNPELEFLKLAPSEGFNESEKAETIFKPDKVDWIGDFYSIQSKRRKLTSCSNYFLPFENNYENKVVKGIDIKIISADNESINIKTNLSNNEISDIKASVYNSENCEISRLNGLEKDINGYEAKIYNNNVSARVSPDGKNITLLPPEATGKKTSRANFEYPDEEFYGQFISGNTYCIELGLYGQNDNLLYRWREYVTIQ